jgi:hypothetical protein
MSARGSACLRSEEAPAMSVIGPRRAKPQVKLMGTRLALQGHQALFSRWPPFQRLAQRHPQLALDKLCALSSSTRAVPDEHLGMPQIHMHRPLTMPKAYSVPSSLPEPSPSEGPNRCVNTPLPLTQQRLSRSIQTNLKALSHLSA